METQEERPSFIIQNITPNYHYVSDISFSWGPKEIRDLTWEDPIIIKKSKDLKSSLRSGILKQLNEEEYEKSMDLQYKAQLKELNRQQKDQAEFEKIKVDDSEFEADTFEIDKSRKVKKEIDITGTANHPLSYARAYEVAQNLAREQGDELSAEEFGEIVDKNPDIVPSLLTKYKTLTEPKEPHKAFYAAPSGDYGTEAGVKRASMTNYNRDAKYAGLDEMPEIAMKASYIKEAINYEELTRKNVKASSIDHDFEVDDNDQSFAEEIVIDPDQE
jgi:muconolactone delta-isomerase